MARTLQKLAKAAKALGDLRKPKELREEEKRQRRMVKDTIWPYLLSHTKSVPEAQKLLRFTAHVFKTSFETMIAEYQKSLNEGISGAIRVADSVSGTDYENERAFLELFKDEKVCDAMALINGMSGAIEEFIRRELKDRTLDTLKAEFLE